GQEGAEGGQGLEGGQAEDGVGEQEQRGGGAAEEERVGAAARRLLPGELPFAAVRAVALAAQLVDRGERQAEHRRRDRGAGALVGLAGVLDVGEAVLGRDQRELAAAIPLDDRRGG